MPTIRKRGDFQYQAIVRRTGFPLQSKTFLSRKDAEAWAARIESEILSGSFSDRTETNRTSLGDLLARYSREVSPQKKGGALEQLRIQKLLDDPIAQVKIAALSGVNMSHYRDRRLKGSSKQKAVSGSTVNRELTLISHVISVASKEWGIHVPINPVSQIRRPKENRARSRRLQGDEEQRLLAELLLHHVVLEELVADLACGVADGAVAGASDPASSAPASTPANSAPAGNAVPAATSDLFPEQDVSGLDQTPAQTPAPTDLASNQAGPGKCRHHPDR